MGDKIVVGPINKGLKTDRTAFVIDNDSFPTLINSYQWRGRVKRKRGTSLLTRLQRYFNSSSTSYSSTSTITLDGSGNGNLLTGFSLQTNGNIIPGSVSITGTGPVTYTDPSMDGTLSPSGSINYATGAITISAQSGQSVTAIFSYYPDLAVMGLEDIFLNPKTTPGTIGFDTTYSYNINNTYPYAAYDVSFYKNPSTNTYLDYVQKTNWTKTSWNGQNYQQFWTTNYQGAFWATNGITVPFTVANIGMQYKPIVTVTIVSGGPPAKATLQITAHGLVVGDFVFVNEVSTTTGINFQTGYVITVTDANDVIVEFPNATIASDGSGGIAQYLTNRSDPTQDCLRWYDGDPTNGNAASPSLIVPNGWVNFAPPLSQLTYSIDDNLSAQYYLVGARVIIPFKDRLIFIGPVIQTSSANSQLYLQDTIIYSQNGTPFYTASFTGSPTSSATVFNPILVPVNQTSSASAYFEDVTGFGGFLSAGISSPILTASPNEDAIIFGFNNLQVRMIYTGNDIVPFNMFIVNSELGTSSTFSFVNMDKGILSRGSRGFIVANQTGAERIDLEIPDSVFEVNLTNNGTERICAQRDFINEWIYFTYPSNIYTITNYPNQTLQYNYRDDSWAVFYESYTTYGQFKRQTGFTWNTVSTIYPTWESWTDTWESGESTLLQAQVIGGNQQGFVMVRADGTGEGNSLYIQSITGSVITSPDHGLNTGDYIVINGCIGTYSTVLNGNIFSVYAVTQNTFTINPNVSSGLTYLGLGVIKRMYIPQIQTKQFPVSWDMARKTRLGPQQYLFSTTAEGQITLLIFLSQDSSTSYNYLDFPNPQQIVPEVSANNSIIYSSILYTCPEGTNLGLTPANVNLNLVTAEFQQQTWHRMNTSLVGDTVQIGFSLNDSQMRDPDFNNQFVEIELHSFILDVSSSQMLC